MRVCSSAPLGGGSGGAIRVPLPFVADAELPATGVAVGVLVAMGIALTVVGRSLVQAGRTPRSARPARN